jgi:peptidoglycan/xylan/chitin deacetylase (PgdA/CDA1 family)
VSSHETDVNVALTFDFDAYSLWIGTYDSNSPSMLSRGEFGPVGVMRILELLAKHKITATFFIPGHTVLAFPKVVRAIHEAGHEIAHHGWVHENPATLSPEEERAVLEKGLAIISDATGSRPVGYRSPAWDNSTSTVPLLLEYGFEYESSLMGGDFEPYWCRVGDSWSKTTEYSFGKPVNLVELPVSWSLDDFPHFEYVMAPNGIIQAVQTPRNVLEIWTAEFDYLYDRIGQGLFMPTMHPQVIGRGHRMMMLEAVIEHMIKRPGVTFTTCRDYSRKWRAGKTPSLPVHVGPA